MEFVIDKASSTTSFKRDNEILTEIFLLLHCEKNADGTKNLILKGHDMQLRIYRRIDDVDMISITVFLKKFPVIYLDLCYNEIGDEGLDILVSNYFKENHELKHLNLVGCNITESGIQCMCENMSPNELTVKDLRLNGNKFGGEGGKALALFLDENEYVEHLDVGETDQTLESVQYFMKILNQYHGHNQTIKVLNISRPIPDFNRYNYDSGHLAEIVATMLSTNYSLVELHLQKCQLDAHDLELLLIGLEKNDTLLFLDIGLNRIGDYGIELLAKYLKKRPALMGLNVSANGIQDIGARALSLGMPFSRIRLLDISHNNINDPGIIDILNSIKKPMQMRLLYMWGNDINHPSCVILKRMFKSYVLKQDYVDVVVYEVDQKLYAAYLRCDRYKHLYYCELDYGIVMPIKIKKNPPPDEGRHKLNFKFYPPIPGFRPMKKHSIECTCCACRK